MREARGCRRCLLEEIASERDLFGLIQERIRLLADGERTDDTDYLRRLARCRACGELHHGTCLQCGCYVELRAAKRGMHCPHIDPKW